MIKDMFNEVASRLEIATKYTLIFIRTASGAVYEITNITLRPTHIEIQTRYFTEHVSYSIGYAPTPFEWVVEAKANIYGSGLDEVRFFFVKGKEATPDLPVHLRLLNLNAWKVETLNDRMHKQVFGVNTIVELMLSTGKTFYIRDLTLEDDEITEWNRRMLDALESIRKLK